MKTIDERANEYIHKMDCSDWTDVEDYARHGYEQGATDERALQTRWHDPKDELPSIGVPVLLKVKGDGAFLYIVNIRTIHPILGEGWGDGCGGILDEQFTKVLGWREIHE